eukprot:6183434-Pleurochrysis_carterae.AAC.1
MPPWAWGIVWDWADPSDCQPVVPSFRDTRFRGRRQLNRAVLCTAATMQWRDRDIVEQAGEGDMEERLDCELLTVLAFHHPGLLAQATSAAKAVEADMAEGWVAPPTRHLPFVPCRLQPRDVILQARQRLIDNGCGRLEARALLEIGSYHQCQLR